MIHFTGYSTALLMWGITVHLVLDWLFQNDPISKNKSNLKHPLAYVHSGIHLIGLLLVFPPLAAFLLALSHLLIDTRIPLTWWRRVYRQTSEGDIALHVAIWSDQVLHIFCIAIAAFIVGR